MLKPVQDGQGLPPALGGGVVLAIALVGIAQIAAGIGLASGVTQVPEQVRGELLGLHEPGMAFGQVSAEFFGQACRTRLLS
jgi:hypothetical protein